MNPRICFAVVSENEDTRHAVARRLDATGAVRVVQRASDPQELATELPDGSPLGLYVDLDGNAERHLTWIEELGGRHGPLLAGGPADPELILRSMRLGALGFFPGHDMEEGIHQILERVRRAAATSSSPGHLLAVLGAKGGVGATTVACQLAASLAKHGPAVVVDVKLFGDVAFHFDLTPEYSLADVASREEDLDATFLESIAQRHGCGVSVVAAPQRVEEADAVDARHLAGALPLLRDRFAWVIADLPRITDEVTLQTLDLADQILLVTTLDLTSLARARQHLALLERLGHAEGEVRLVVNRATSPGASSRNDRLHALGAPVDAFVPEDWRGLSASLEQGRPIAERGSERGVSKAFAQLALDVHAWCKIEPSSGSGKRTLPLQLRDVLEGVRCRFARA